MNLQVKKRIILVFDLFFLIIWRCLRLLLLFLTLPIDFIKKCLRISFRNTILQNDALILSRIRWLEPFFSLFHGILKTLDVSASARRTFFILAIPLSVFLFTLLNYDIHQNFNNGINIVASYYDKGFINRRTANGEIFTSKEFTAAHKTLPFNTILRLRNPESGKTAVVRINDRGPFIAGRDLDLSRAAAEKLGMIREGVIPLQMWIIIQK